MPAQLKQDLLDLSSLRFLVADDHQFQRDMVARLLQQLGAGAVYCACDGAAVLRALDDPATPVDILVLDLAMPGFDGVEVMSKLSSSRTPVAVIVNSSFGAEFLDSIALIAEGNDVNLLGAVTKPLNAATLRSLVDRFMETRSLAAGLAPVLSGEFPAPLQ